MPNTAAKALLPPKIQVFLLAYDLRSFTQVAKTLKITQPAVSKVIGELENELGFDLFVRDSRPLTVTPEADEGKTAVLDGFPRRGQPLGLPFRKDED